MLDRFHSPKRRVWRARSHLLKFDEAIKAYFDEKPWHRVIEASPDGTKDALKIRLTKAIPNELSDIAVEVAEGLRSALDQAAFATVPLEDQATAKSAYFPLADNEAQIENAIKGRCKNLHPSIVALFRSFKPYRGGNDVVWALNKVCNSSKHKLLVPMGMASSGMHIRELLNNTSGELSIYAPKWDRKKEELIFATAPKGEGENLDYKINFSFVVIFGEVDGVDGQDALGTLSAMANETERIVNATEAEAKRLGLIP